MRTKIVAGNWKMNKLPSEAAALIDGIKDLVKDVQGVEVVVCPPFTDLKDAAAAVKGSNVALGAQNVAWAESGAFTGEISAGMLKDLGVEYVIIGHSERRQYFGETDETVNRRLKAALAAGLKPIVCVGEKLEEREAGQMPAVIEKQVKEGFADLSPEELAKIVIAYEPVWAIGTGKTATPKEAQEVHALIRRLLAEIANAEVATSVRIQYGGSMKPANAKELMDQPDIDGGLIGGAALKADSFADIVKAGV
ncbi:MAG: triose-phosphate isomerase [Kiritimatiellae bacterium]|nr:triose-phosphate isomerase [Kiritimatiellia bacterium]